MPTEKWNTIYERLRQMDRGEILDRGRQALAKRSDALLGWLGFDFAKDARRSRPGTRGNFFFALESVESILSLIRQRLPGRVEQIIQEAEQICQHRFGLLGYKALDYGSPFGWSIDWHCDVVHGKHSPRKAFYRIRYLDYEECGDSKIIWELNRHQHLVTLAKAYRLTNDRRYVDEILRQKRHWQAENPYPFGINWASSLEVAFRSLSWLWTYYLLQGSPGVPALHDEWLRGLALHGRHIERYLSTYFSPNTHLLGEGVALFFLGVLCPELVAAERWKSLGWEIVLRESERQIRGDGFHFEQSTYYHVYALDFFLHAAVLAAVNGIAAPKVLEDRIEKMLAALCLLGRDGPPPRFGDDDGGRLFDPRRNRAEHLLDPLATGAILFHRGDFKGAVPSLPEETLWLLGEEGVRQWDQLEGTAPKCESAALLEAGYYLLATERTQLFVDAGLLGALSGGHGHADALSICLQSHGHSLLIDPGTAEYVGPGGDRDFFRGTEMHNTLRVDGMNQAETAGVFSWRRLAQSKVEHWVQGHSFEMLVASQDGYQRLDQPVTHRRWVISLKNGVYVVRDVVEGAGKHPIEIAWHFRDDLDEREGVFRAKGAACGLAILPAQKDWKKEIRRKACSPVYGEKAPMTTLIFDADIILPADFAVVLVTSENAGLPAGSFDRIDLDLESNVSAYQYSANDSDYFFFFNERGGEWQSTSVSSDAKCVCHKRWPGDSEERLAFCNGSYAKIAGGAELRSSRRVAWAELVVNKSGRTICSSDPSAILNRAPDPVSDAAPTFSSGT